MENQGTLGFFSPLPMGKGTGVREGRLLRMQKKMNGVTPGV